MRLTSRKSPVIRIVSISKVSKSVVACHPETNTSKKNRHITCCYYLCNHLAKLLQKIIASKKPKHIRRVPLPPHFDKPAFSRIPQTFQPWFVVHNFREFVKRQVCKNRGGVAHVWSTSHVPTIFRNHLAKLLQRIVASQKTNTSHHMLLPSFVIILQSCYKRS